MLTISYKIEFKNDRPSQVGSAFEIVFYDADFEKVGFREIFMYFINLVNFYFFIVAVFKFSNR